VLCAVFIFYIIAGLRRLIEFNINADVGEAAKYFVGIPTPLGAILLWILYLLFSYNIVTNSYVIGAMTLAIAWSLNSKLKIRHP
jgi:CDP-diacylglycerol--serine O-phosphatidyltransferase